MAQAGSEVDRRTVKRPGRFAGVQIVARDEDDARAAHARLPEGANRKINEKLDASDAVRIVHQVELWGRTGRLGEGKKVQSKRRVLRQVLMNPSLQEELIQEVTRVKDFQSIEIVLARFKFWTTNVAAQVSPSAAELKVKSAANALFKASRGVEGRKITQETRESLMDGTHAGLRSSFSEAAAVYPQPQELYGHSVGRLPHHAKGVLPKAPKSTTGCRFKEHDFVKTRPEEEQWTAKQVWRLIERTERAFPREKEFHDLPMTANGLIALEAQGGRSIMLREKYVKFCKAESTQSDTWAKHMSSTYVQTATASSSSST